ncbi:MAG TPA: hypothetical protein VLL97_12675 [Acidobacteriota bacterium]|nr:hypothetical protein [Acidobacteriota bacterium]
MDDRDPALERALKSLPDQTAPPALLPRVMNIACARASRNRALWLQWRWLPATLAAVVAVALSRLGERFYETSLAPMLDRGIAIVSNILSALARPVIETVPYGEFNGFVPVAAVLLPVIMYLTCIGLGSFVYRAVRR